jgi:hypothetical protein
MSSASFWEKGKEEEEKKNSRTKPKGALSQVLFSFLAPAPVLHTTHSALALYTLVVHYTHTHTAIGPLKYTHGDPTEQLDLAPLQYGPKEKKEQLGFSLRSFSMWKRKKRSFFFFFFFFFLGWKKNWQCRDKKKKEEETLLF